MSVGIKSSSGFCIVLNKGSSAAGLRIDQIRKEMVSKTTLNKEALILNAVSTRKYQIQRTGIHYVDWKTRISKRNGRGTNQANGIIKTVNKLEHEQMDSCSLTDIPQSDSRFCPVYQKTAKSKKGKIINPEINSSGCQEFKHPLARQRNVQDAVIFACCEVLRISIDDICRVDHHTIAA